MQFDPMFRDRRADSAYSIHLKFKRKAERISEKIDRDRDFYFFRFEQRIGADVKVSKTVCTNLKRKGKENLQQRIILMKGSSNKFHALSDRL